VGKKKINIRALYLIAKRRYFNYTTATVAIALFLAGSWAWGALSMMDRNYTLQKELDDKYRQLQLADLETSALEIEQKYFKTREYQELAARKNLGLVMPGESVLILPANTAKATSAQSSAASTVAKPSNFSQWMKFFSGGNVKPATYN
jgi:cell division protein FtsB